MNEFEDIFKGVRPDHEDFRVMAKIVNELDAHATELMANDYEEYISEIAADYIDSYSLSYMAIQRTMRLAGISSPQDLVLNAEKVINLSVAYLEGVLVGVRLQQERS